MQLSCDPKHANAKERKEHNKKDVTIDIRHKHKICAQDIYHSRLLCILLPHTMRFRTLIIKLSIHNFLVNNQHQQDYHIQAVVID